MQISLSFFFYLQPTAYSLQPCVFSLQPMSSDSELLKLAAQVGAHLKSSRRFIVTAESCTGGWIGKVLTDVAGCSAWFEGGAISYSNRLKESMVGVDAQILARHGAVSEAAVRGMAEGALHRFGADVAVAVSGIAGPDGGTPDKPVGTVWFAWSRRNGSVETIVER